MAQRSWAGVFRPAPKKGATRLSAWTVAEVIEWLRKLDLGSLANIFEKEAVDGATLADLTDEELKSDLGLTLGQRKKILRERGLIIQSVSTVKIGPVLAKGYLPQSNPLTQEQRMKIKFNRFDPKKGAWVGRDIPLSDEELECWDEQFRWLVCPITGKKCSDGNAILGIGLYHAPRFLSEAEQRRALDEETQATNENKRKRLTASSDGSENSWSKEFEVYPSVIPPPKANLPPLAPPADDVRMGSVQVIIGPVFDKSAYNDGIGGNPQRNIMSQESRGILSMDQQYNAVNFVYHIPRAKDSYELKLCSSRLSIYIDEFHGKKVFPKNIESQLSLLLYRTSDRFKEPDGTTNQRLLASAILRTIPRILKAVVVEVVHGHKDAMETRLEHAVRTYLLVHQISIKLVLYYKQAFEMIYRSAIRWIQNPFTDASIRDWPDLDELLLGVSLVGIPWSVLREAFVRKFFATCIENAPKLRENVPTKQRLRHLFLNNQQFIQRVMYELSFFLASKPLLEQDRIYSRCAGSLPKSEREKMKKMVLAAQKIDSMEEVWLMLGMDSQLTEPETVQLHLSNYLGFIDTGLPRWKLGKDVPQNAQFKVPSVEELESVATVGLLQYNAELALQAERALAEERKKHLGYPIPASAGRLDPLVCNYPLCGKKFKCRDHLFAHLNRMIDPARMIKGFHQIHFKLQEKEPNGLQCEACQKIFDNVQDKHDHYADMGVPGYFSKKKAMKAAAKAEVEEPPKQIDQYDSDSCVICLDAKREVVNVPCGHLVCCKTCGFTQKDCPICRSAIKDAILVFYS